MGPLAQLELALDFARYHRNGWAITYFVAATLGFLLISLVVTGRGGDASRNVRRAFGLNLGIVNMVLVTFGATIASGDADQAAGISRLGMAVALFVGPSTLHFCCALVGWREQLRSARLVAWISGFVLCIPALFTNTMVGGAWHIDIGWAARAGVLAPLTFFQVLVCMVAAFAVVIGRLRITTDPLERRQLRAVVLAYSCGNLLTIDTLPLWGIEIFPTGFISITATTIVLSYAIREHRLFDAPDFGWRAVGWALASALITVPLAVVLWLFSTWHGWGAPLPTALVLFGLFLAVHVYVQQVQPLVDDLFLRRRRDLVREIDALADKLLVLHTADAIAREVARLLHATLYVKLVAFATRDAEGPWRVVHSAWGSVPPPDEKDPLLDRLRRDPTVVRPSDAAAAGSPLFTRYGAEAILPLTSRGGGDGSMPELVGLVAVGPRPDAHPFEPFELAFLARLRAAVSGPLAAARLYDRRHRLRLELEHKVAQRSADLARALANLESAQSQLVQSEKMATLGLVTAGVAAELEAAVGDVGEHVPRLEESARAYDEAATAYLAALPAGPAQVELLEWARKVKLDFVRRDVRPLVEAVGEGARRARGIAADLRRFARADEATQEPVDLHRELDATLNLLRHDLKNIHIDKHYATLPVVECDGGPIGQVFMNLLINAAQAIEGTGVITVRTGLLEEGRLVEVAVRDTGKGIAAENLGRIFEPFFTTKAFGQKGGTGLGLSISYGIVQRHGGKILVESALGKGTEFRVLLPVNRRSL